MAAGLLYVWSLNLGIAEGAPAQSSGLSATATQNEGCQPWTMVFPPNPRTHHYLNDIDALAPNDVWAVGEFYDEGNYTPDTALAMHWDGTAWTIFPTPRTGQRGELLGVAMIATNDVWAVGLQFTGGPYIPLVLHWDGTAWTEVATPTQPGGLELRDVVALAPNNVWAVGANDGFHSTIAMHWDGTAWAIVPTPNGGQFSDDNVLESVTAISPNDIWAVGYIYPKGGTPRTLAIHWNGTQWTLVNTPNPGNYHRALYGVSAVASNDVWAVGMYSPDFGTNYYPLFLRWNGTTWQHVQGQEFPDYNVLDDVHAIAPNDIWAVGTTAACNFCAFESLVMHWDGSAWTRVFSPNGFRDFSRLEGVTAVSASDVWAVGFSDELGFPYTSDSLIMRRLCAACAPGTDYLVTATANATMVPANNRVPGSGCSNCTVNIPLPFAYTLYDRTFTSVNLSSEGNLQFGSSSTLAQNTCLPNAALNYAILPYWDNLDSNIDDTMGAFTSVTGTAPNRVFAIRWYGGREAADSLFNYEVLLYEGQPKFEVIYGQVHERGFSATIGVQKGTGQNFTQFSCNTQSINQGTKLTFDLRNCP